VRAPAGKRYLLTCVSINSTRPLLSSIAYQPSQVFKSGVPVAIERLASACQVISGEALHNRFMLSRGTREEPRVVKVKQLVPSYQQLLAANERLQAEVGTARDESLVKASVNIQRGETVFAKEPEVAIQTAQFGESRAVRYARSLQRQSLQPRNDLVNLSRFDGFQGRDGKAAVQGHYKAGTVEGDEGLAQRRPAHAHSGCQLRLVDLAGREFSGNEQVEHLLADVGSELGGNGLQSHARIVYNNPVNVHITFSPVLLALASLLAVAPAAEGQSSRKPTDGAEMVREFDALVPKLMKGAEVPGAVIVAVHDRKVLFRKGYGYADVSSGRGMDPDHTALRIASVSKTATAVLVMQLVGEGRIGLDEEVAQLLGSIRIENPFPKPVTVRELLTHTAGLDKLEVGRLTRAGSPPISLEAYLRDNTPPVVRPPGEVFSYSNHGYALAGEIVARKQGMPFPEAARKYLFEPLGMESSTFEITPEVVRRIATGYRSRDGRYEAVPLDLVNTIPASMMVTTGDDFGKFLQFLIGESGDRGVLPAELLQAMERVEFKNHPALASGYGYGFFVEEGVGGDWVWHTGDMDGWFAEVDLYPSQGFGIFMGFNSDGGEEVATELRKRFQSRLNFARRPVEPASAFARSDLQPLCGTWVYINEPVASSGRIQGLFDDGHSVTAEDGRLRFDGDDYKEIAPHLFQAVNNPYSLLAFRPRGMGGLYATTGIRTYRRLRWYDQPHFHRIVLLLSVLSLLTILGRAVSLLRARSDRAYKVRWGLAAIVFALFLAFLIGFVAISPSAPVRYGLPTSLRLTLLIGACASALSCLLPVMCLWQWRDFRTRLERFHYILFFTGALALALELLHWGQIG
jgi:CubicO group peptidase (beta-lactamase class C family)